MTSIFNGLSKVFSAVPSWLKEKLSPGKVSNGECEDTAIVKQRTKYQDAFHTPPLTKMLLDDQGKDIDTEGDNMITSTSISSSAFVESHLQDSQLSILAVPLNASLQSTNQFNNSSSKTLQVNRKRRLDHNESAESSTNVSRTPNVFTEDSDLGINSVKRARPSSWSSTSNRSVTEKPSTYLPMPRSEMFQSPFYPGNTTYGGASAYRFEATRSFRRQVISVKNRVKPADKPRPMSTMARRIYEALESYSPPAHLETPRRQMSILDLSSNSIGPFTGFSIPSKSLGPTLNALPLPPSPARVIFPPLKKTKELREPSEFPLSDLQQMAVQKTETGGKIVTKVSDATKRTKVENRVNDFQLETEEKSLLEVSAPPKIVVSAPLKPLIPGFENKAASVEERNENYTDVKCIETISLNDDQIETLVPANFKFDECPSFEDPKLISLVLAASKKPRVETNQGVSEKWTCKNCLVTHGTDMKFCPACEEEKDKVKEPIAQSPSLIETFKECFLPNLAENGNCAASTTSKPRSTPLQPKQPIILVSSAAFEPKPGGWTCPGCRVSNEECAFNCISCSGSKHEAAKPSQETISSSKDSKAKAVSASASMAAPFQFGVPIECQDSDKVLQGNEAHDFKFRVPATPTKNIFVNSRSGANAKPTEVCPLAPFLKRKLEDTREPSQETIPSAKDLEAEAVSASANVAAPFRFGVPIESQDSDKVLQGNEVHDFKFRVPATPTKNIFVNSRSGANANPTQVCPLAPFLKRKSEDTREPSQETISSSKDLKAEAVSASANVAAPFQFGVPIESQDSDKVLQGNEVHDFKFRVPPTPTKNIFVNSRSGANAKPTQVCPLAPFLKRKSEDARGIKVSVAGKNANIIEKGTKRFKPSVTSESPGKQVKLQEKITSSGQNHLQYFDSERPFGGMRSGLNVKGSKECEKNFRSRANVESAKVCPKAPFLKQKLEDARKIKVFAPGKNAHINERGLKRFKPSVTFESPGKQVELQAKVPSSSKYHSNGFDSTQPFGGLKFGWNAKGTFF